MRFAAIAKSVQQYRDACKKGDPRIVVATYRALQPFFAQVGVQGPLATEYSAWTGRAVPSRPHSDVVIQTPRLLPWTIALCSGPPWPSLPAHAIPVSVLELIYLQQAPEAARERLHEEIVKAWERGHLPSDVRDVLRWFEKPEDWEVISIRATPSGAALFSSPFETKTTPGGSKSSASGTAGSASAPGVATSTSRSAGRSTGRSLKSPGSVAPATLTDKGLTIGGSLFE